MRRAKRCLLAIAVSAVATLAACGDKDEPNPVGGDVGLADTGGDPVTYTSAIREILEDNCTGCHATSLEGAARNGASANVNFDTFEVASQSATRANARVQAGSMPPGGGLASDLRALFQAWVDGGAQE